MQSSRSNQFPKYISSRTLSRSIVAFWIPLELPSLLQIKWIKYRIYCLHNNVRKCADISFQVIILVFDVGYPTSVPSEQAKRKLGKNSTYSGIDTSTIIQHQITHITIDRVAFISQYNMNLQQNRSHSRSRSRSRSRDKSLSSRGRAQHFQQDEEEFQADQQIIRSLLRIEQCRQQPIDRFVKVVWIYKGKLPFDHKSQELMTQPKSFLSKLTLNQLEDLIASTLTFEKTESKLKSEFVSYWKGLRVLVNATIANKRGENVINSSFLPKVNQILAKPYPQLLKMQQAIELTLSSRGGSNETFWNFVKFKIEEKKREFQLQDFYGKFKETHQEQRGHEQQEDQAQLQQPISPILGPVSLVNPKQITTQEIQRSQRLQTAQKIFKDEFQKSRERLEENLSLPKNHNLLSTDIINESTQAYDFITQEIIEFQKYKRMEEDEQEFDDWVPCETEGRFRSLKPQCINRKRVTIEWNKYNTMHYSQDNPPPKTIQGYKFNIFYPDLYDKQKTPQYYLQTTQSPDYCIIKFKAGPPYKDIAFKILRKEWDFTQKSGFQSIFHKGILQLYFNFKKPKFRI